MISLGWLLACSDAGYGGATIDAGADAADTGVDADVVVDADPPCPRTSDAGYVRNRNSVTRDITWWPREVLAEQGGIPLLIDPKGTEDLPEDSELEPIRRAMATWTTAAEGCGAGMLAFREVADGDPLTVSEALGYSRDGPNMNVLTFVATEEDWAATGRSRFTIAATTSSIRARTSDILDVDIELNDARYVFTDEVPLPSESLDLQSALIHEFGHLLGFNHTASESSVMWPTEEEGVDLKRELDPMDRAGVCEAFGCY